MVHVKDVTLEPAKKNQLKLEAKTLELASMMSPHLK